MGKTIAILSGGFDVTVTSVQILPIDPGRRELTIVNDGANVVYLNFGTSAASAGNGVRLNAAGGSYTTNNWEGPVQAIALTATTRVTIAAF
jgi:hypothetical protein